MYRNIYNIPIYGAIFFNHESPRRSDEYVTQKIIRDACEIYHKKKKKIYYVFYSWKIMQLKKPDFFVVATGRTTSVRDFLKITFSKLNLDYKKYLIIDKKLIRPAKTSTLTGNTNKAKKIINYKVKTNINTLIDIMLNSRLNQYR